MFDEFALRRYKISFFLPLENGKTGDSIQGKGYFRGEIYATNGEFSGVVRVKALYQDWQSPDTTTLGVYQINPDLGTGIKL